MAIYAFGATYGKNEVTCDFIENKVVGFGWDNNEAPDLHCFISSLKVGDIVYIKSYSAGSEDLIAKAIGIVTDNSVKKIPNLAAAAILLMSTGLGQVNLEFPSQVVKIMFVPTQCMKNFTLKFKKLF